MTGEKHYHHGDLKAALLHAAERILTEEGSQALTLRACARKAGVSHAAPAHHFGNLSGLLTALAITAFDRLAQCQKGELSRAEDDPRAKKIAVGLGYIRFALENPALFELIFRDSRINRSAPEYREAVKAAGEPVLGILEPDGPVDPEEARIRWIGRWSRVHGFATLAISGALARNRDEKPGTAELLELAARMLGG